VFVLGGIGDAFARPRGNQIGKVYAHGRAGLRRRAIAAPFDIDFVAAQVEILAYVIKKKIDRGQGHRLRREPIVRRREADLHLVG
jgi:hypothetical protein